MRRVMSWDRELYVAQKSQATFRRVSSEGGVMHERRAAKQTKGWTDKPPRRPGLETPRAPALARWAEVINSNAVPQDPEPLSERDNVGAWKSHRLRPCEPDTGRFSCFWLLRLGPC